MSNDPYRSEGRLAINKNGKEGRAAFAARRKQDYKGRYRVEGEHPTVVLRKGMGGGRLPDVPLLGHTRHENDHCIH
jgi:hypothetical protein